MRLIAYTRVSTGEQTTEQQDDAIRGECQAHGHELIDIVTDHGASGANLERPGVRETLRRLKAGEADGLIVAKLDRLTRSVRDLGDLLEAHFARPRGKSIALVSVAERIDTEHAAGRFMLNVLMSVAQWERETISERTKAALAIRKKHWQRTGGIPYGYRLVADKVHLQENPAEQAVITRVWQLRGMGLTQRAVVDQLRQEGVVGRTGNPLALAQVQRILKRARAA